MRALTIAPCLLLAAAAPPAGLREGLWEVVNTPTSASLDGRPLADLPFVPPPPERVCVTAVQAADPAAWFTRDSDAACTFARRAIAGGRVAIVGTCPASDAGKAPGTVSLTGRWTPTGYTLRFVTIANGENGRMGFGGTLVGRRLGDCPPLRQARDSG